MSFVEVWSEARQRRRLILAAAAREMFSPPAGGATAAPQLACDLLRAGYALGADALKPSAPLPSPASGAGANAQWRAWDDVGRLAALQARVEPIASAWFAAGVRLCTVAEITDERQAVLPLSDPTPALVWAHATDWDATRLERLARLPRVAVLHSRKPRELHGGLGWVAATPAALAAYRERCAADAPGPVAIGGRQARWELLTRAAVDRAGWPCIDVLAEPLPAALAAASAEAVNSDSDGFAPALLTLSVCWPERVVDAAGGRTAARNSLRRDDVILALATAALAVDLRADGNWQQRLRVALAPASRSSSRPAVSIAVVDLSPDAKTARTGKSGGGGAALIECGAARLQVTLPNVAAAAETVVAASTLSPALVAVGGDHEWPYLTHWTRRPDGPWPDETIAAWLQAMLPGPRGEPPLCARPRTALEALARMVTQRRIVGGGQFLRQGPAVCFTQLPPASMLRLAADLRGHRGLHRPRYEPFGIALRREYLLEAGVEPAIYGDEATFAALPPEDRFRFQWAAPTAENWSREGEWRLAGDLDFRDADPVDFFLLAPDASAAARLAAAVNDPALKIAVAALPPVAARSEQLGG